MKRGVSCAWYYVLYPLVLPRLKVAAKEFLLARCPYFFMFLLKFAIFKGFKWAGLVLARLSGPPACSVRQGLRK